MPQPKGFSLADILLIIIAIIWGINVVVVKAALTELGPLPFNSLRFLIAAMLSWALLKATGAKLLPERADIPRLAFLGLLGHTLYQVLFISGIALTTAGNTALLLATIPVWVAALAALTRAEVTGPLTWAGIGLSVTGIVFVTTGGGKNLSLGGTTWLGDVMVVSGAFFYALYTLKSKALLVKYSPLQFTTWTMTAGATALLLSSIGPLAGQDWSGVGVIGWGGLAYSSVLAIVAGYYVWINGVQKLGAARTAVYNNLTPLTALITGSLFLGEAITITQVMGAVLIITGLYVARRAGVG
jgi:drug/metabolite transporter (DMT)-like permease